MSDIAKILIGNEKISDKELNDKFVFVFKTMCQKGIPIMGFLNEPEGQYMFGWRECFENYFNEDYTIISFDAENYINTHDNPIWLAELDPFIPERSKLIKYAK